MKTAIEKIVNDVYEQRYCVIDNFISANEIATLVRKINLLSENKQLKQAGIGKNAEHLTNTDIRSDFIYWVGENDTELQSLFFHFMPELTQALNRRFYLGLKEHEFHLALYPPGSFYKKHKDAFKSDDARKITVLLYLNQNWKQEDGGELILYKDDNSSLTIEPLGGRLLVFESEMEHEVLLSKANRYSLTGWIKNKSRLI
ncbi:MAG: 2OG-Fe(II) oxygenase [Bacteroidia bacterium]|nr:2OG-Fe(II) oxygenase [Bacteroidia bacterium]